MKDDQNIPGYKLQSDTGLLSWRQELIRKLGGIPHVRTFKVCAGCSWNKLEENQCSGGGVVFPRAKEEEKEIIWNWDSTKEDKCQLDITYIGEKSECYRSPVENLFILKGPN